MNKVSIRLALIPLLIGCLHAALMIYLRLAANSSLLPIYERAVAVHAYSLLICWPILLIFENSLHIQVQRILGLIFLLFYFVSVFLIWTNKTLVHFKYIISPSNFQFLGLQFAIAIILILSASLQTTLKFKKKSAHPSELLPGLFLATQSSLLLIGIISLISFGNSLWKSLYGISLDAEWTTLWLGLGHLPIQLMSLMLLEKWLIWIDFSENRYVKLKGFFQTTQWSVPAFIFLVFLNQIGLIPWNSYLALIPNLFVIPVVLFVGYRIIANINRIWLSTPGNVILMIIYCLFTFWGGLTGLQLAFDPLVRSLTIHTLLMPSHFHPLVAVGFTGTILGFVIRSHSKKIRKTESLALVLFLAGIAILSYGLRLGGFGGWTRRVPFAVTENLPATLLISSGGFVASLTAIFLIFKIFRNDPEKN